MARHGILAAVCAVLLSGCAVTSSTPPGGGLNAEEEAEYARVFTKSLSGSQSIEYVPPAGWGAVIAGCMNAAGYPEYVGNGTSISNGPSNIGDDPDQQAHLDTCLTQYPILPDLSGSVNLAQLDYLYDYFRDFLFQATNLTTPILTRYHVLEKEDELRNKLLFLTKINTALAFMGGGVILIVGHAFIATWMGANYLDAYPILVVLVVAMMFEITIDPSRCALAAMGKNRLIALLEMGEAALNVTLSIILGIYYGPIGVALGTAIPLVLMKVFVAPKIVCTLTKTRLPAFYGAIAPIVLMTAVYLAAYGYIAHQYMIRETYLSIIAVGALAVPLYLLLAYRFFFDASEIALLKQMLPGRRAAPAV